jgi:serine/threonine-protein kinase RsbT
MQNAICQEPCSENISYPVSFLPGAVSVRISSDRDILLARQRGRELAAEVGFTGTDLTLIATAISELARNILLYARYGEVTLTPVEKGDRKGVSVVARDYGPGIPELQRALQGGHSTASGDGLGLPGVRRAMHEFKISSQVFSGTTVTLTHWTP